MNLGTPAPERSFERALDGLRPKLRTVFVANRVPPEDAEDLLQQSLLAYLYKRDSIEDFERWLIGAVRNRCRMYWRGRRRRVYTAVDAAILDELADEGLSDQEQADFKRDLDAVLCTIPERCQKLLRLRFRLGYDLSEAAAELGYRPSGIYKTLERCLAALAHRMTRAGLAGPRR